jgi:hypothetical protein
MGSPSALPSRCEQISRQGGQSNFFGSMCKELCSVAPGHSTHYEAATHLPTQVSREATLGSNKEAPFDDATHRSKDGIRSGSMQCNQCPLGTTTTASRDEDHGWEVGSSGMRGISATTCSGRRLIGTPIEYFKRLLEEACLNFAYPIGYKLKDCSMIQSFMTSGSLTWGAKPDERPDGSDVAPFPKENAIMMVFW